MQREQIAQQLKEINLNLDPQTIKSVQDYLIEKIGFLSDIQLEFQLYAAVAIVSEIQKRPTIGQLSQSTNGIKIENVMSHLGSLSKERFLDTANRQLQKDKQAPQFLKKKVEDVRYSYRFYKKYQMTFDSLWKHLAIKSTSKQELSAMFWVVFLYIKNTFIETQNITESKCFFILLIRMIFEKFLCQSQFEDNFKLMQDNIGPIPEISVEKYKGYLQLVQAKLNEFYSLRFSESHVNFAKMMENYTMVDRLVDDMSNSYVKEQIGLRFYNDIDELSYLELKKNITPQVFRKPAVLEQEEYQVINTQLSFEDDDDDDPVDLIVEEPQEEINQTPSKMPIIEDNDGQPTPKPYHFNPIVSPQSTPKWKSFASPKILSSKIEEDIPGATPISKKCQNEGWMNRRIELITPEQIQSFEQFFQQLSMDEKSKNLNEKIISQSETDFSKSLKASIYQLIKQFTPKCRNYEERFSKIMALIISNYSQIEVSNKKTFNELTTSDQKQKIIGIATLSCEIFNYIHNSVSYEFKSHCEVFSTDVKTAFDTLKVFTKDISTTMPLDLKEYLQKTTKRFFVDDIWNNGHGYKIICETTSEQDPSELHRKIVTSAQSRIKEICRQAKIEPKIVTKTQNMIKFIFEKKPYLLKNNNIDQIILCCIMSCLSINQKQELQNLEVLFFEYNSNIQFSFNSNQTGLKDQYGNEMKIVDYYNEVFLAEIQDMLIEKQDQLDDFLLTPVRITKRYFGANLEKNILKKKQPNVGTFMFNPERTKLTKTSYRQSLIRQNSEMKEEKEEDEQDNNNSLPSPNFGMSRTFTFGDLSGK